jgi:predicted permease
MHDVRQALRSLRRQPVFTLVAALTLALGLGANSAIFSVVYQSLLQPLPYRDPQRLVFIWNSYPHAGGPPSAVSIPDYLDRRSQAPSLEDAALFTPRTITLSAGQSPEQLRALAVTPSFFSTLGRRPVLGRAFSREQARPGADRSAILTYALWISRFGGDRSVLGRVIHVDGEPTLVTGVLPRDFDLPWRGVSLLVPFAFTPQQTSDGERGNEFSYMIGRLRTGASIAQLDAEMQTIVARLIDRLPARAAYMRNTGFTGVATPIRDQLVGDIRPWLYLLQGGVALVLLIASVNVANLLGIRAVGRRRDLAVRLSLGATRWHVVRYLSVEAAILAALGTVGGVGVASASVRGLRAMAAEQLPERMAVALPPPVAASAIAMAAVVAVLLVAVPALSVFGTDAAAAMKDDASRGSPGRRTLRLRSTLVVAETALSVALLVPAGLLAKGFVRLTHVDPGFSPQDVVTADVSLPAARYADAALLRGFWDRLLDRVRSVPGVAAAGLISTLPLSGPVSSGTYHVVGRLVGPGDRPPHGRLDRTQGGYFKAMGIPLLKGRLFDAVDAVRSERVVIVDRLLERREFPGGSALGHRLNFGSARDYTIVGVVGTVRDADLAEAAGEGRIYFDGAQIPLSKMTLTVKTAVEPASIVPLIREAVRQVDPEQAIGSVRTMDDWIARSLGGRRTPMALLALFGAIALALATIGIYGVTAFGVTERFREFGIRMALGADGRAVVGLVMVHGVRTVGGGILLGLALAAGASQLVASMLFGVQPYDALVFGIVAAILAAAAAAACYLPARRATRLDPTSALREG